MAGKAEAMTTPTTKDSTPVQNRSTWGSASGKGGTPRIENQITVLEPNRSPRGSPRAVPSGPVSTSPGWQ